jgi:glycosyltransferase involved in cell wall biosynthesis
MTAMERPSTQSARQVAIPDGELPFVSVLMPIRNEAGFIAEGLQAVLTQDYPADRMEIIVADGMSDDGTREIVAALTEQHARVRLIDNPGRIVSTGLNAGIRQARGEIVIRLDGHAEIACDFIRQNVRLLAERPEAWVVGGPIIHAGRNPFSRAAAIAMSSPFGVGLALHRFAAYEGYAEGAAFPAIRAWVFDRVGDFDERLVRNQDDEWNYRVTQAGGRIFISPRVRYTYFVRDSATALFRQYFQYAFWRIPVIRKHRRPTTLRQMVPPLFFVSVLLLFVAGLWMQLPLAAVALPAAYCSVLLLVGVSAIVRHGVAVAARVPVALAAIHVSYALGLLYGFWTVGVRPSAWDDGHMSTLSR